MPSVNTDKTTAVISIALSKGFRSRVQFVVDCQTPKTGQPCSFGIVRILVCWEKNVFAVCALV